MKKPFTILLAFIFLFLVSSSLIAFADDLQDGLYSHAAGDYDTAHKLLLPFAEQGNAFAQLVLGSMYEQGKGVSQDCMKAFNLYQLSAEQGNGLAQSNLSIDPSRTPIS